MDPSTGMGDPSLLLIRVAVWMSMLFTASSTSLVARRNRFCRNFISCVNWRNPRVSFDNRLHSETLHRSSGRSMASLVGEETQSSNRTSESYGELMTTRDSLVGSTWMFTLDIGREKNTWMPPQWAASGRRMQIPMLCTFKEGGVIESRIGPYLSMGIGEGNWRKVGNLLKFWIEIEGFEKFDVSLPKGKLHFTTNAWGNVLRQKGNVLTIRAVRFYLQHSWRGLKHSKSISLTITIVDFILFLDKILGTKRMEDGRNICCRASSGKR
mmetsp:Transcript_28639/g.46025  ORF Transcript_28639/g.46025 Transcript_28639/m.46025 type:complete len:268 (-) Transcript_28639:182-985(-)